MDWLRNIWVKRGLSAFSYLYGALLVFLVWMSLGYQLVLPHPVAAFVVYVLLHLLFLAAMLLSRKQVSTAILGILLPPLAFGILILNMGDWFLVVPPVIASITCFFAVRAHETLKTIMGAIYLILYVVGILFYFAISAMMGDLEGGTREKAVVSPDGNYRYVFYTDMAGTNIRYDVYVEPCGNDVNLGFVRFEQSLNGKRLHTSRDSVRPQVSWEGEDTLVIEGKSRDASDDIVWTEESIFSNLF